MTDKFYFTVFTPAYNRAKTLPRVFDALSKQTFKDFEWIVVDDGSSDNTREVIDKIITSKPDFPVRFFYQENSGKHIATNFAVQNAGGMFFITLDSDDSCVPEALEVFKEEWEKVPDDLKPKLKGISCRTCSEQGRTNGGALPSEYIDTNDLDLRFKYKVEGELWGMTKIEILKSHPYPDVKGLHFYPENILWNNIGREYNTRFIDRALRVYINDTENALTNKGSSAYKETFYMREHFINECWDYFKLDPKFFIKQTIGLSRDGILCGKRFGEIKSIPNSFSKKLLTVIKYPLGKAASRK